LPDETRDVAVAFGDEKTVLGNEMHTAHNFMEASGINKREIEGRETEAQELQQRLVTEPTGEELFAIAREISPWWKEFALFLQPYGMSEQEILEIEGNYQNEGLVAQSMAMLQIWHDQHGSEGSVRHLCVASLRARRRLVAEKVFGKDIINVVSHEIACENTPQSIEIELFDLAKAIGAEWPNLAICLGLSAVDIEVIKADVKTTIEQAYRMLIDWYWDNGSQVTIADIAMTVEEIRSEKVSIAKSEMIFPAGLSTGAPFHGRG
jgi:hypothetical protein